MWGANDQWTFMQLRLSILLHSRLVSFCWARTNRAVRQWGRCFCLCCTIRIGYPLGTLLSLGTYVIHFTPTWKFGAWNTSKQLLYLEVRSNFQPSLPSAKLFASNWLSGQSPMAVQSMRLWQSPPWNMLKILNPQRHPWKRGWRQSATFQQLDFRSSFSCDPFCQDGVGLAASTVSPCPASTKLY